MHAGELLKSGKPFLTLGGVETYLVFDREVELPEFSSFVIFDNEAELANLETAFLHPTFDAARAHGFGLVCDLFLWRAAPDYLSKLGYASEDLEAITGKAVDWMRGSARRWRAAVGATTEECPILLGGEIGPRGDGYNLEGGAAVSAEAALDYHGRQMRALRVAGADVVFALTMTSASEAIGVVRAAREVGAPIVVSPTVETDGAVPGGMTLGEFIQTVDEATDGYALFYMVNCAHPSHLEPTLAAAQADGESWLSRFKGLRANASAKSHEELDNSTELDAGDPSDLATRMADLQRRFALSIIGGCCGTDATHIAAIAAACGASR